VAGEEKVTKGVGVIVLYLLGKESCLKSWLEKIKLWSLWLIGMGR
jgi:hypothetical protein